MLYFKASEINNYGYATTPDIDKNITELIVRVSVVRGAWGFPMSATSGLRNIADQTRINPINPKSNHLTGKAVDIADTGVLWLWSLRNLQLLKDTGLWLEHFNWTHHPAGNGWVHFQIVAPISGHRIYVPSSAPALSNVWNGKYDSKFDGFDKSF
jgi:hypothetical protein